MIFKFEKPIEYKPLWINSDPDAKPVFVTFLTIKQIIIDPLLKKISVLFFEAPSPLIIFDKEEYTICLNLSQIVSRIEELIKNNIEELLINIFEIDNQKTIQQNNLIISEVNKLKINHNKKTTSPKENSDKNHREDIIFALEEIQKQRLEICKGCEFFDSESFSGTGQCNACGCPLLYKIKKSSSVCPKSKWKE